MENHRYEHIFMKFKFTVIFDHEMFNVSSLAAFFVAECNEMVLNRDICLNLDFRNAVV